MLVNEKFIDAEIKIAKLEKKDRVIEIGAGIGNLTKELVKKSGKVLAFEVDSKFKKDLDAIKKSHANLTIVYDDSTKYLWRGYDKIVANIPYFLSDVIIIKAIESNIEGLVLVVGEKFKDKLFSDDKIGLHARLFYDVKAIVKIPKEDFVPVPRVDSWLIKFVKKKRIDKRDKFILRVLVKKGKIKNALISAFVDEGLIKKQAREKIRGMNIEDKTLDKPVKMMTGKFLKKLKEI